MKRIALVSLFDENFRDIGQVTARNKFEYCARYDYSFHLVTHRLTDPPTTYSKAPLIEAILPLHDWMMWIDSDALIMNFNIRLETYLDEEYSLVIGADWNGINAGVFFLRNCAWSFRFLKKVKSVPREGLRFFDQSQMAKVITDDPSARARVKVVSLKQCGGTGDFNCYPTEHRYMPRDERFQYFDHGDFIAHFVGTQFFGEQHRLFMTDLIKSYAKEVIR